MALYRLLFADRLMVAPSDARTQATIELHVEHLFAMLDSSSPLTWFVDYTGWVIRKARLPHARFKRVSVRLAPFGVGAHHIHHWEHGGDTDLNNLIPLCSHHHHLVHDGGWTIELFADRAMQITRPDGTIHATTNSPARRLPTRTGLRMVRRRWPARPAAG